MNRLVAALLVLACVVPGNTAVGQDATDPEGMVQLYFHEVVNRQKLDLLSQVFADTITVHNLLDQSTEVKSLEEQKDFLAYLFSAFPDIRYTIGDVITEDETVAVRVTLTATHEGEFWGYEASGNTIDYLSEVFFYRFEDGKIVELWTQLDLHNLFSKLRAK